MATTPGSGTKTKPKPQSGGGINLGPPPVLPQKKGAQPPAFIAFVNKWSKKYPGLKQWAPQILTYAKEVHIDPVYFASVIVTESGANANVGNSSAGAVGIAQIMPLHIGEAVPWNANAKVTAQDLKNPVFALRWSAYHLRGDIGNYGYQGAYTQGYNPGFTPGAAGDPLSRIPKGYLPGVSTPGTSGAAGSGAPTGVAGNPLKDPWAVLAKGAIKFVSTPTAPKNVLRDAAGDAITRSYYISTANQLDNLYLAFTGHHASAKVVANYIKNPISDYQLRADLGNPGKNPFFYKSPSWTTFSGDYDAVYKGIFGNNANPPKALIAAAISHNLTQTAFQDELRKLPQYEQSQEFKGMTAQFRSAYEQIYGTPDATGEQKITQAAKQGWNGDQWTQYLRAQPEYKTSGEFQKNLFSLFNSLGFTQNKANVTAPLAGFGPQAPTPAPSLTATGSAPSGPSA